MTKLAERTNTWFIRPSTCARPSADEHLHVFASLVSLLGPKVKDADLRIVHAYFRYLLLGCDPVTSTAESHLFDERRTEVFEKLLDFTDPCNTSPRWNLLLDFLRDPKWLVTDLVGINGVRRSYMTLALTLLARPKLPSVKMCLYDCLAFYQRHIEYKVNTNAVVEFVASAPMLYASWLSNEIHALSTFGILTNEDLLSTISYLAWFVNLVKVVRVHRSEPSLDLDHFGEVESILQGQVQLLQRALDTTPLRIDKPSLFSGLLDLTGIHPKKKVKQE